MNLIYIEVFYIGHKSRMTSVILDIFTSVLKLYNAIYIYSSIKKKYAFTDGSTYNYGAVRGREVINNRPQGRADTMLCLHITIKNHHSSTARGLTFMGTPTIHKVLDFK